MQYPFTPTCRLIHKLNLINILFRSIFSMYNFTWTSYYNTVTWNITIYQSIRSNHNIIPDFNSSNYSRIKTNIYGISNNRSSWLFPIAQTDSCTFQYINLFPITAKGDIVILYGCIITNLAPTGVLVLSSIPYFLHNQYNLYSQNRRIILILEF